MQCMSVHWQVTWTLLVSLKDKKKGRLWLHLENLGQRSEPKVLPAKKCPSKGKRRHSGGVGTWSPLQGSKTWATPILVSFGRIPSPIQTSYFIGAYNLHYLLFSGIGALLCHHPYCFPSQSQTLFGIGAGRPPLRAILFRQTSSWLIFMSSPWSLVSHLHSNGFCRHGKPY